MIGAALLDANLLVLLVVGSASRAYIARHDRLDSYDEDDFDLLVELIGSFADIVVLPHVWTEVDHLVRSGGLRYPATQQVLDKLQTLIESTTECPTPSASGAVRSEFARLGLADSVMLHFLDLEARDVPVTLITADHELANAASAHGYDVIDYPFDLRHG